MANGLVYWVFIRDDRNNGEPLAPGQPPQTPSAYLHAFPLSKWALHAARVRDVPPFDGPVPKRYAETALIYETTPQARLDEFTYLFTGKNIRDRRLTPAELWRAHFDFVFDDDGQPELYIHAPGWVSRYSSTLRIESGHPTYRWHLVNTYPNRQNGPFYVAVDGKDRHFIFPGGLIHTLPADALRGDQLDVSWTGDPILALVHDSDSGRYYAFTRTHYFHITAKPAPKPHALKAFPGATAEEALDTVAQCGRVIRDLK